MPSLVQQARLRRPQTSKDADPFGFEDPLETRNERRVLGNYENRTQGSPRIGAAARGIGIHLGLPTALYHGDIGVPVLARVDLHLGVGVLLVVLNVIHAVDDLDHPWDAGSKTHRRFMC